MMSAQELEQSLFRLGLSTNEAAQLLSITPRTVRRWLEGDDVAGPAEQAIRAWIRLHDRHLPWRPDAVSIESDDQDQIARHRAYAMDLDSILKRVDARGGARSPWQVDWDAGVAELGPMVVSFYKLRNGGFSPGHYRRKDGITDVERDREMIEDAIYSISEAKKRQDPDFGPVVLVNFDGPAFNRVAQQDSVKLPTTRDAIKRAGELFVSGEANKPFIMSEAPAEILWQPDELRRECERREKAPKALRALAEQVRERKHLYGRCGPHLESAREAELHQARILEIAQAIDNLADKASGAVVKYQEFDALLGKLHNQGLFPDITLVSAIAKSFVN